MTSRAAAFLLQKMTPPVLMGEGSHYFFSYMELGRAVDEPRAGPPRFRGVNDDPDWGKGWKGPMDGGVTYWAQKLVLELSELGDLDAHTQLPEYRELMALLEEAGYPCDAGKMSEEEWMEVSGAVPCPSELSEEILSLLKQRIQPN